MEWWQIIVTSIGTLVGLIGGGAGIIYWRENKALKAAEAKNALTDVEMKQAEEWNKLYREQKARADEKSERLRSLYQERESMRKEISDRDIKIERLCWFYCIIPSCPHREPPHRYNEMGHEIEAEMFAKKEE